MKISCFYEGNLKDGLSDPEDEEYESTVEWLSGATEEGRPFDPTYFEAKQVKFDNPKKRLKQMLGD